MKRWLSILIVVYVLLTASSAKGEMTSEEHLKMQKLLYTKQFSDIQIFNKGTTLVFMEGTAKEIS